MAALQWIEQPGYTALILRRTYKQLAKADSILNKSKEWLWNRAKWNGENKTWTFPNGNTLEFGHMEHEDSKLDYQGGAWLFVGVDECTQFTESMISYPRTRQRRAADSPIPVRWRGASNPGGPGHDYVKGRYVKAPDGSNPGGPDRQFFPARLEDNPNIDQADYIQTLKESGVDPLTLAQLLDGDWDAVPGGRFRRDWFTRRWTRRGDYIQVRDRDGRLEYEFMPGEAVARFITVDPAASTSRRADYTVISDWVLSPRADLVWLGCERFKAEIPDIVPRISAAYLRTKPGPDQRGRGASWIGIEAIASNMAVFQLATRQTRPVLPARPLNKGDRDKLIHATKGITLASTGRVILPTEGAAALSSPPFPLEDVLSELVRFTGDDKQDDHDDCVDTLSYACESIDDPPPADGRSGLPHVLGG
jgi:hypothetical protein